MADTKTETLDAVRRILEERKRARAWYTLNAPEAAGRALDYLQGKSVEATQGILSPSLSEGEVADPARMLLADAFRAVNPLLWGSIGQAAFESPAAERAALDLETEPILGGFGPALGAAAPYARFGVGQAAPAAATAGAASLLGLGGATAEAAPQVGRSVLEALRAAAPSAARSGLAGAGLGAGMGALAGLGEPEGARAEGALTGATDPLNLLLSFGAGAAAPLARAGSAQAGLNKLVNGGSAAELRNYIGQRFGGPENAPHDFRETLVGRAADEAEAALQRSARPPAPATEPVLPLTAELPPFTALDRPWEIPHEERQALIEAKLQRFEAERAARQPPSLDETVNLRRPDAPAIPNTPEALDPLPSTVNPMENTVLAAEAPRPRSLGAAAPGDGSKVQTPELTPAERVAANNAMIAELQAKLAEMQGKPAAAGTPTPTALQTTVAEAAKSIPEAVQAPSGPVKEPVYPPQVPLSPAAEDAIAFGQRALKETRNPGFFSRLYKQLVDPVYRSPAHAAEAIRGMRAAYHAAESTMRQLAPALKTAYKKAGPSGQRIIDAYMAQSDLTTEQLAARGGQVTPIEALPPEWRALFQQAQDMQSYMRSRLSSAGYFSEAQLAEMKAREAQGQVWLHRDYRAFIDGRWTPPKDTYAKAFSKLVEGGLSPDEARADLHNIMNPGPGVTRETAFANSRFNTSILKGRKDLPAWLRQFLGEVRDPSLRTAVSAAELERLYHQHVVSETYTTPEYKGAVWDDTPSPSMYELPIPDDKHGYGSFAGKYVNRQLYESIMQANGPVMSNLVNELAGGLTGLFKTAKVIGSHTSMVTNWLTNFQYDAASGLPPWNPMLWKRLAQSARALRAYGKSAVSFPEREGRLALPEAKEGAWVKMAIEDGALKPGYGREAGGSAAKAIYDLYSEMEGKGIARGIQQSGRLYERFRSAAGELYDMMDQHHRLAVYMEHVTQGRERLGLPMDRARAQASAIVNEFFASAADVGPGVKRLARNTGPLLNPFVSWQVDNARVGLNLARAAGVGARGAVTGGGLNAAFPGADPYSRLFSGRGMSPALNVALYRMAVLGGLFGYLKHRFAISDPEEAIAETNLRAGFVQRNPDRTWLPFRDGRGRMQVVSLGQMDPWGQYLQGPTTDSWGKRIGANALKMLTSGGLSERWTDEVLARSGLQKQPFEPRLLPGQAPRAIFEDVYRTFTPQTVLTVQEAGRRAELWGNLGKAEEPLTGGQAAVRALTGTHIEPSGARSARGNELTQLRKEMMGDVRNPLTIAKLPASPEEKTRLRQESREEVRDLRAKREEIRARVPGAPTAAPQDERRKKLIQEILRLRALRAKGAEK